TPTTSVSATSRVGNNDLRVETTESVEVVGSGSGTVCSLLLSQACHGTRLRRFGLVTPFVQSPPLPALQVAKFLAAPGRPLDRDALDPLGFAEANQQPP